MKACKPGTHNFVWDKKQNEQRIDGGNYHWCSKCGQMASSKDAKESWLQKRSRWEGETAKAFKDRLRRIK